MIDMATEYHKPDTIISHHQIDITGFICPMTFVQTKLMLEKIAVGDVLEVRLKGKEPLENVPKSAGQHGHTILGIEPESTETDVYTLWIKKEA